MEHHKVFKSISCGDGPVFSDIPFSLAMVDEILRHRIFSKPFCFNEVLSY